MSTEFHGKIYDPAAQRAEVRATTTHAKYLDFVGRHFRDLNDNRWHTALNSELGSNNELNSNPDFFRFLGLVGIVCAQYGFPSLQGQIGRYEDNDWHVYSPVSPRHQLAVATYVADLNIKSYPIKNRLVSLFSATDPYPAVQYGVQGLFFRPTEGKPEYDPNKISEYRSAAHRRFDDSRAICLPDEPLNEGLANLGFTAEMAERMPQNEFEQDILPEVQNIVGDMLDPVAVFSAV